MVLEVMRTYSAIDSEGYESHQGVFPGTEFDHLVGMKTENLQPSERKFMTMWAFDILFPYSDFDEVWFTYSDFPEKKGQKFRRILDGWSFDQTGHEPTYRVAIATNSKTRSVEYYISNKDKNFRTVKLLINGDSIRLYAKDDSGWYEAYGNEFNEELLRLVGKTSISEYEWEEFTNPDEY